MNKMIKKEFENLSSKLILEEGLSCEDIVRKLKKQKIDCELDEGENKLFGVNNYFRCSTICIDAAPLSIDEIERKVEKVLGKPQLARSRGVGSINHYYGKHRLRSSVKLPKEVKEVAVDNQFRLIELTRIYYYKYEE